jgi:hypothetical protein
VDNVAPDAHVPRHGHLAAVPGREQAVLPVGKAVFPDVFAQRLAESQPFPDAPVDRLVVAGVLLPQAELPSLMYLATLSVVAPIMANSKSCMPPAPLKAKW